MTNETLRLEGVTKRYRRAETEALAGIDLAVTEGESLALIGHNGAGKTTLMKMVLGLAGPSSGTVRVWGCDPRSAAFAAHRTARGYLPENVVFAGGSSGRETLRFFARLKGASMSGVDDVLERLGLGAAARRAVGTYSKGMRQRLGLAQAVLGAPRLLVFDEPTSGLDPALRDVFYDICESLRGRGATVLVSSHSLSEIERRADRIAILRAGRVVAVDTLDGLRAQAGIPITIRVRVSAGAAAAVAQRFGGRLDVRHVNERSVDFACAEADKVALLRELSSDTTLVEDLDVSTAGLDALYRHFTSTEERT
jgi:Cu-processing system ATP-binding protein